MPTISSSPSQLRTRKISIMFACVRMCVCVSSTCWACATCMECSRTRAPSWPRRGSPRQRPRGMSPHSTIWAYCGSRARASRGRTKPRRANGYQRLQLRTIPRLCSTWVSCVSTELECHNRARRPQTTSARPRSSGTKRCVRIVYLSFD